MSFLKAEFRDTLADTGPSWSMSTIPELSDHPTPHNSVVFRTPTSSRFTEQSIYATSLDSTPLYSFSQQLDLERKEDALHFYMTTPRGEGDVNDGTSSTTTTTTELYKITKSPNFPWPHGPEYICKARDPACLAKTNGRIRRNWGMIKGVSWIVSFGYQLSKKFDVDHQVMQVRYHKGRWRYGPQRLVVAHEESTAGGETRLVFEGEVLRSKPLQDIVVCACVVRLWFEASSTQKDQDK